MIAALGEANNHATLVDKATWTFTVPANETLASATLWRASRGHSRSGETGDLSDLDVRAHRIRSLRRMPQFSAVVAEGKSAHPLLASENRVVVPSNESRETSMATSSCFAGFTGNECGNGFGDPSGYAVAWYLYAADLVLEQTEGPSARNVTGPLATEQTRARHERLIFRATDPGAGVYQAVFNVDGHVVQETVIDENGGHCRNVGQTTDGLPAFLYLQPCLKSLTADVGFDSTSGQQRTTSPDRERVRRRRQHRDRARPQHRRPKRTGHVQRGV